MLFSDIDKKQTLRRVRKKLRHYHSLKRIAGEEYSPKVTATYSLEPRSSGGTPNKAVEEMVIRKIRAEQELEQIEEAINKISAAYCRQILVMKYLEEPEEVKDFVIYTDLGYPRSEYFQLKERAMMEFAECYRNGALLVFSRGGEAEIFGLFHGKNAEKISTQERFRVL